jgi:hypothetical protein
MTKELIIQEISDWRERHIFVTLTGSEYELKKLADLASFFEKETNSRIEIPLAASLIERLETSVTLENHDQVIARLQSILESNSGDCELGRALG